MACYRVVERADRVHCGDLRTGHHLVEAVDRRKRRVDRLVPPHPFVTRVVQHVFGMDILDRAAVSATRRISVEPGSTRRSGSPTAEQSYG